MPRQSTNLLCSYRYDPLDRMVACTPSAPASTQRFYLRDRLATEIQGTLQCSIMQHDDQLLAQQQRQASTVAETSLLATDQLRSVLTLLDAKRPHAFAFMPYGYCLAGSGLLSLLGFNGERPDPVTGWYLLGTGYHRPFNPVLMCFTSPDSWSPFGAGGLNAYAYCTGDPVNSTDPQGHTPLILKNFLRSIGIMKKSSPHRAVETSSTLHTSIPDNRAVEITALQETIDSMQKTISSQQQTISSQQNSIAATHKVISDGRVVVNRYEATISQMEQLIIQQQDTIESLKDDLSYYAFLHSQTTPNSSTPMTQRDIDMLYGPPISRSTAPQPGTSLSDRASNLRN